MLSDKAFPHTDVGLHAIADVLYASTFQMRYLSKINSKFDSFFDFVVYSKKRFTKLAFNINIRNKLQFCAFRY